ncbi:uncharacterized protein SPPG_05750 [Spizellomyces punctatus DAOM BR117]|uniref:Uncharacterized protein n=1 Tax=Spizellomyces punctatus (strain DAOM BR117) TaxID=645134 RepID=A0A0L0HCW2_SPIPD|nr:uncharacterized protein SPPG_05750 [Spizellomyces punctatus DAOM BR117]KNC98769.1 hypothetical protein SPPG_05750 [Spizellomyces punctatus DAOM BR117]|eukprot:XP_016606809.1 hypothetical protein SPPG_05750 [Spizellomyces punctatus DAOM BR117]
MPDNVVESVKHLSIGNEHIPNTETSPTTVPLAAARRLPQKEKLDKPKKPPKPGSKAAILLKQQQQALKTAPSDTVFIPPIKTLDAETGVLILAFQNSNSLRAALGRPHVAYEGGTLKGPLKGVNFPMEHLANWAQDLHTEQATEAEKLMIELLDDSGTAAVDRQQPSTAPDGAASATGALSTPQFRSRITYICAYVHPDRSTLLHEWAHARFYLCNIYRSLCESLYSNLDDSSRRIVEKELSLRNYKPNVYIDEWQAYCVESPMEFGKKSIRVMTDPHRILKKAVGLPPSW